jgi:hypothetical protein
VGEYFVDDLTTDNGHSHCNVLHLIDWNREQILLQHDQISPLAWFDGAFLLFLER